MAELLRKRVPLIEKLVQLSREYSDIAGAIISGINPTENEEFSAHVSALTTAVDTINAADTTIDSMDNTFIILHKAEESMTAILATINNPQYSKLVLYNMSSTHTHNIRHIQQVAGVVHGKYIALVAETNPLIFEVLDSYAAADMHRVIERGNVNKFTIAMMKKVIKDATGQKRQAILDMVSKQIDNVLGGGTFDTSAYSGSQGMFVRNLVPKTRSMPLAEILALYNVETLEELGATIINNSSSTPIEFDMSGLTDLNKIMTEYQSTTPISGLTKKMIARYNTAYALPAGDTPKPAQIVGDGHIILETLNGSLYRVLGAPDDGPIDAAHILHPSKRPHQYNTLQSGVILSKCFSVKSKNVLSNYEKEQETAPSTGIYRRDILNHILQKIGAELDARPVKLAEFRMIVTDPVIITEAVSYSLLHGMTADMSAEHRVTRIAKINSITRVLIKELTKRWQSSAINERLFRELSRPDLVKELKAELRIITLAALNELEKNRVWASYTTSLKEYFLDNASYLNII